MQLPNIVLHLLKENNIEFNKSELFFQIQSHPSYPSLHAVTGVLNHFNIENVAAKVEADENVLHQLPACFIAQIADDKGQSLVSVKKKPNGYTIYNGVSKGLDLVKEDFIKKFTGIIVAVEENENKIFNNQNANYFKIIPLVFLIVIATYLFYEAKYNILDSSYSLLSLIGIFISIAILKQEIGLHTKIGDALCSSTAKTKDCDAVLSSNGAKIFKEFKLSDLSLIYFLSLILTSIFIHPNNSILFSVSIIALPIVIYSIYYQYFVTKSWCFLCLTIGAVLVLQGVIAVLGIGFSFNYTLHHILIYSFVILFIFMSWNILKPYILELKKLRTEKIKDSKFQKNYTIFETLLKKKKKIDTSITATNEIILGNKNAALEIVIITNPFCGHCKEVHILVEDILKEYKEKVKLIIRFNVQIETQESELKHIVTRLYELYFEVGKVKCLEAMHDIYNGMSTKKWFDTYGKSNFNETYIEFIRNEKSWCTENNINFTPEILINGYSFPKEYNRTDLKFFMEDLIEETKKAQN